MICFVHKRPLNPISALPEEGEEAGARAEAVVGIAWEVVAQHFFLVEEAEHDHPRTPAFRPLNAASITPETFLPGRSPPVHCPHLRGARASHNSGQ